MGNTFNRRAQLHIMETIITLLVFCMLLAVAVAFYAGSQRSTYESELGQAAEARVIALANIAAELPELQCSDTNVGKDGCVDRHICKAPCA